MSTQHIYNTATPTPQPQPDTTSTQPTSSSASTGNGPKKLHVTSHNQYSTPRLERSQLNPSPLRQFNTWLESALKPSSPSEVVHEPEAMTLSTCTTSGVPSSRVVLLKTVDERGFIFFTNYNSRKSSELSDNPYAALTFYWREVSKSIRVVGKVEKVSRDESKEYFATRPKGSQIGAWASRQSTVVQDGEVQRRVDELEKEHENKDVDCPEHWGGWRVVPFEVEFWSGQPSRLHDRFRYTREKEGESDQWVIDRLAP